jgi:hypothetical protein
MIRLMLVLTCFVIVTPLGSAVREKLTVALEKGDVRRYSVDALKVKNNWGTTFPVCGIGPVVLVTITAVPLMLGQSMYISCHALKHPIFETLHSGGR